MSYVIYDKKTTIIEGGLDGYATEAAAKAALTRMAKKRGLRSKEAIAKAIKPYAIAERKHFFETIEKKETRTGIVHSAGAKFEVGVNTPWTSGPWSETYWSS